MKYDKVLNWLVTDVCNFHCEYCIFHNRKLIPNRVDVDRLMNSLNNTGKTFEITLSGGEPFLVPNIIDLLKAVTQKHFVSIVTNFTSPKIIEFYDVIDPQRVVLCISIHFHELEKRKLFDRFIKHYKYGIEKGFDLQPRIVGFPGYIEDLDRYLKILHDNNIRYFFTSFSGIYKGKNYPESYTPEEIELFNLSKNDLTMWNSYHKPCPAGWHVTVCGSDGHLFPCYEFMFSDRNIASNLFEEIRFPFDKPVLCPFKKCGCPFYLYQKSLMDGVSLAPKDCENVDLKIKLIKLKIFLRNKKNGASYRIRKIYRFLVKKKKAAL